MAATRKYAVYALADLTTRVGYVYATDRDHARSQAAKLYGGEASDYSALSA